jgi:methyl-CpG-binding domain protein 4
MSPLRLFQERYAEEPWKLLCCVICLNLCSGRMLETIHLQLFKRWPTALHMAVADLSELEQMIAPLGLQTRRAKSLMRMSAAWACLWDGKKPDDLPGIGKYGSDSYRLFIRGELDIPVEDKELRKYLEWIKSS